METLLRPFQHLKIPLEEIISATNNFDNKNYIGGGSFGKVYKGEVSHSKGRSMAAIKRLDSRNGQRIPEFFKEIALLSDYMHENLISLLGFCYQGREMTLVYEHASRGSLDLHLNSPHLTWTQRLKICLDAAKGLNYLHDPRETHQTLVHCDIKSSNILLDDQWNAKVSDLGLSIIGSANEQHSVIVTSAAGTEGYIDPQFLVKESDIYSFGVVLFEVLCGRLCATYNRNGRIKKNLVHTWIESYKQKHLNDIIFKNPAIQPLDESSLERFSDIAYQCLKESLEDRPKMAEVVAELDAALVIQEFREWQSLFDYEEMTKTAKPLLNCSYKGALLNQRKTIQDLKIQLEDILLATNNFDHKKRIGRGGFGVVYKGEVSHSNVRSMAAIKRLDRMHGQGKSEFRKEIEALSCYRHANLISLLGFCDQGKEMILVYEYASNGSLDRHLDSSHLTWTQRLKICLDVAKGLNYLHDPKETHQRLIHRDIKSMNILLDDQWNAKISDFGLSRMGPANEPHSRIVTNPAGTPGYCDPQYMKTYTLTKESDIYSFGVVLFEVLCGRSCYTYRYSRNPEILVPMWIERYKQKKLNDIIFKKSGIQPMTQRALETFSDIAYRCLKENREDRPNMAEVVTELETALGHQTFLQQFQHLKIQLEEITSATNNFDHKNYIGRGGFGEVYKGEVSHSNGRSKAAIKRLDRLHGQGRTEFFKEIMILSRYTHENLISLLGFCYEQAMILVYEHASRGSLDHHLNSRDLTWTQRLNICLDAAKGLAYLHDQRERHQRLINCDIKSTNILLDEQWSAKISNLSLSTLGAANNQRSVPGYWDPQFAKESDVYSFGVVLFEVLCGTLCCTYSNGLVQQNLVPKWIESYKRKQLNDIIFKSPIQPLEKSSLEIFSDIAYRCLKESHEEQPNMAEVVRELETALESQEYSKWEPLIDYEEITNSAEPPLKYRSKVEMRKLLSKGILLNHGKTWFSLNKKGEHCEMICFAEFLDTLPNELESSPRSSENISRFPVSTYHSENGIFKACVKAQFLSPLITYTVNLVFKMYLKKGRECHDLISLRYKLQGETKTLISYLAYEREDGWWMCELYQFTSDKRPVDLEILFDGFDQYSYAFIEAEGVEFRPLEKVEHKDEELDMQPILDPDANWEEKLPTDYEDIIKWSKNSVQWTTKKEAYSIICKGFLIDDGEKWISLDKNGKKCHMLSARAACIEGRMYTHLPSLPESRFGEAFEFSLWKLTTLSTIRAQLVSPHTRYASYLVYKLPKDHSGFEAPVKVKDSHSDRFWYVYLVSPQTPVITPKGDQNTHNPLNQPKIKGLPQQREDGWTEVQIWEFRTFTTTKTNLMCLKLSGCGASVPHGLIIQGVEFRPLDYV